MKCVIVDNLAKYAVLSLQRLSKLSTIYPQKSVLISQLSTILGDEMWITIKISIPK